MLCTGAAEARKPQGVWLQQGEPNAAAAVACVKKAPMQVKNK